jgi:hypothetical protein
MARDTDDLGRHAAPADATPVHCVGGRYDDFGFARSNLRQVEHDVFALTRLGVELTEWHLARNRRSAGPQQRSTIGWGDGSSVEFGDASREAVVLSVRERVDSRDHDGSIRVDGTWRRGTTAMRAIDAAKLEPRCANATKLEFKNLNRN